MTTSVFKAKNYSKKLIATGVAASLMLSACGSSDTETVVMEVEVAKSAQAPLIFTFAEQVYFITEQPEFETLSGGSGSGDISFTVSDSSIATVDANSGTLTLLDDGTFTITATKAGDDVYQATSASFQLTVNKFNRQEFQNIRFAQQRFVVDLDSGQSPGNLFFPTVENPKATSAVEVDFNLQADATILDSSVFDPNSPAYFHASTSITVYDSLGESHVQTFYFIKDNIVVDEASSRHDWLVVTSVDGILIDFSNADGSAPDASSPNLVGTLSGMSGNTGLQGVAAARLSFSESGDFIGFYAADGIAPVMGALETVSLGSDVISNGADATQSLLLDLFLDETGGMDSREPSQLLAPFEISAFQQDGYPTGWLSDSLLSYSSLDDGVATVNDLGELTLVSTGQTRIVVSIAEDERFLETSVSYHLVVE